MTVGGSGGGTLLKLYKLEKIQVKLGDYIFNIK